MSADGGAAVVTGASHGIGREIACVLGERGFAVRGIGLDAADLEATRDEARSRGIDLEVIEGDVCDRRDVARLVDAVEATGRPLRALCNNAAVRPVGTVLETEETDWDRAFAVNVKGAFLVTRALLPRMIDAGGGSVVNISSCSAYGSSGLIAYSSSKLALVAFTRCLAEDHRRDRIRANVVLPGPTRSGMTESLDPALLAWCAQNGVQNRLAEPADVASAVAFLASEDASTVTGAELRVNTWPSLFG